MTIKTNKIKAIHIIYPELMSAQAGEIIKKKLLDIEELADKKSEYFMLQEEATKKLNKLRKELDALDKLYEVEYEYEEVADREEPEDCNLLIVNPEDYRNKH